MESLIQIPIEEEQVKENKMGFTFITEELPKERIGLEPKQPINFNPLKPATDRIEFNE